MPETVGKKAKIVKTEGTVGEKPRIEGTRVRVIDVVQSYEQLGYSIEKIASEYDISVPQVLEALKYYYEHPKEIRKQVKKEKQFIKGIKEEGKAKTPADLV